MGDTHHLNRMIGAIFAAKATRGVGADGTKHCRAGHLGRDFGFIGKHKSRDYVYYTVGDWRVVLGLSVDFMWRVTQSKGLPYDIKSCR